MTLPATMRAAIVTRYGGPETVILAERPVPVPGPRDVLVEVKATTVNSGDMRIRSMKLPKGFGVLGPLVFGFGRPRQPVLGTELSGIVVGMGREVTRFALGDAVIAQPGLGTHQHYVCVADKKPIVRKPDALSFEEAAALCFGGTAALDYLRRSDLKSGETILVIGAVGTVGAAMVQLARHRGARVVAATSQGNRALASELGADETLDYRVTDYTRHVGRYDVIADTVGATDFDACFNAMRPGGRFLSLAGGLGELFRRGRGGKRQVSGPAGERIEDVELLVQLAEQGAYRALVDSVFPFDAIAQAHARAETGRKRGSVVVRLGE